MNRESGFLRGMPGYAGWAFLLIQVGCRPAVVEESLPIAVQVTRVEPRSFATATRYSATVKELQKVELSFKVAGTIDSLYQVNEGGVGQSRDVQVGDMVPSGCMLVRLDDADYRRRLNAARERLAKAESYHVAVVADAELAAKELARRESLAAKGAEARENLDVAQQRRITADATVVSAEHDIEAARIDLQQAQDDLDNCALTVPHLGRAVVAEKFIERGERVVPARTVFLLMDVSKVRVAFGVPERLVADLALGQELPVEAESLQGQRFTGRVSKIAPAADLRTRTFLVEVTIDQPGGLKPGMIVTICVGQGRCGVLLPMTAIQRGESGSRYVVYKVVQESGREVARPCQVELDGVYDNQIHLADGANSQLAPGDTVVVVGAWRLSDGQSVRVLEGRDAP